MSSTLASSNPLPETIPVRPRSPWRRLVSASLAHWRPCLAFDFADAGELPSRTAAVLAQAMRAAHQDGRRVYCVGCSEAQFERLISAGLSVPVHHAPHWPIERFTAAGGEVVELGVQATPETLPRLTGTLTCLLQRTSLPTRAREALLAAVEAACRNACEHGSPLGPRNQISVACYRCAHSLTIEIVDQGPGFSRPKRFPPQSGLARMAAGVDSLDVLRDATGLRVRLRKRLPPAPPPES